MKINKEMERKIREEARKYLKQCGYHWRSEEQGGIFYEVSDFATKILKKYGNLPEE